MVLFVQLLRCQCQISASVEVDGILFVVVTALKQNTVDIYHRAALSPRNYCY